MTRQRGPLYALLAVVAVAAAVLSFAALRDLALLCGFSPALAWLLPVTVDAGAASGSFVWLARWTPPTATRYGRTLALLLLTSSVGGNALGHGLSAYDARPHWLVVVGVSAIAPAVLGALVHLVVLVGRPIEDVCDAADHGHEEVADVRSPTSDAPTAADLVAERAPLHSVPITAGIPTVAPVKRTSPAASTQTASARVTELPPDLAEQAAPLIAAGYGRPRLAKELGITTTLARSLLDEHRASQ